MDVPVWLLDIDGVVNAYGAGGLPTHAWPKDDWIVTKANGFNIWAARPVLDFIRSVHTDGSAEIRWHTTWQNDSHLLAEALDLPEFPVQPAPEFLDQGGFLRRDMWWKLPAAQRVLAEEKRRLVWTDDDAAWSLRGGQEAELSALGPVLVLAPSEQTGLCPRHLRKIGAFLTEGVA